jgi:hypothetical protein
MTAYLKPSIVFGLGVALAYELIAAVAAKSSHLHMGVSEVLWILAPVAAAFATFGAVAFGLGLRSRRLFPRRLVRILASGFVLCALVLSTGWLIRDPLSSWADLYQAFLFVVFLIAAFVLARHGSLRFAF